MDMKREKLNHKMYCNIITLEFVSYMLRRFKLVNGVKCVN